MAWQLLVIDGADKDRRFPLADDGTTTIGSSRKNCDVVLHDLYVSRSHCHVGVMEDRVMVADMESASGTFINGQRITQQEMRSGDVLRVGNSHLRLQPLEGDADADVVEAEAAEEEEAVEVVEVEAEKTPAERLAELEGQTLGHYEVGSLLGKGHRGMVFRAKDLKTQQVVALKVLLPEFPGGDGEMQVFVKALKLAMPLQHEHLVKILGAGKHGAFTWMAQEYVEGESLAQVLERMGSPGKLTWKHALRLGLHVGKALQFIHKNRQIHGNLTPANVLVRFSDKFVKLNDFLLDKALEGSKLQAAMLKAKLVAEMGYLAPEQTEPGAYVDHLADIYSLGALMYARMTCQPPFKGKTPEETLTMIRKAKLAPPSAHQEAIPEELDDVVMKMLARRQEDRYARVGDVLSDLEKVAEEQEVEV
ncbi:MAG TPA: FHA domain-containing serine/threonine-protein kinase [Gemmataceae bacterium]|nr:FHA domain-containing serine/threonine-protein kinase [Gemmataceae bacterium]